MTILVSHQFIFKIIQGLEWIHFRVYVRMVMLVCGILNK